MKKKVVLGNVKYFGDKKDISLNKSELGNNVFSDVNSLFGDKENTNMTDINAESLLDLAANTSKAKHVNTGAVFGSLFGFSNFDIDNDKEVSLPSCLSISLDKKWVDSKIVKTQVEVSVRKSFALNINLSAIEGKLESLIKAIALAREKEIIVNNDLKKQKIHSNWAIVIKKIPMNMPKKMIIAIKAVVEFAKLEQAKQLASKWFFFIGKDSVHVAMVMRD
ncbi:hypothetical protein G9A89_020080 [Geosiphon pyriformis]|nr:hypothetical protein G9A89_020080 [Geosiphon pyriformis]